MGSEPALIEFPSQAAMAARLADLVTAALERSIAAQGLASLALAGGTTPATLYQALAARRIDWSNVTATLVDERFVPPSAPGSNEAFVRATFLRSEAAHARFVGLWNAAPSLEPAAAEASTRVNGLIRPFDVVVLGMGVDGHAASWFPGAEGLGEALSDHAPLVVATRAASSAAAGPYVERLSMSLRAVRDARLIVLVISGAEKRRAYEAACAGGPVESAPVRAILRARPDLWACWAP